MPEATLDKLPFPVTLISNVMFGLAIMIDTGEHDGITLDEVKLHAFDGDLIEFLKAQAGGYFASNLFDEFPVFSRWYAERIAEICTSMDRRERRKYGIEKRGLALLVAYTAEILQSDRVPLWLTDHNKNASLN